MQIKKILFPTDFSTCSEQAFDYALEITRRFNAELHLLHCIVVYNATDSFTSISGLEAVYEKLKDLSVENMTRMIEKNSAQDLKIEQQHIPAISAGPMIIDYAEKYDIDLIVMGTNGRQGVSHMLLGSIAEKAVQSAKCPVLTVREKLVTKADGIIAKILVPIDFSQPSLAALEYAKNIARIYQSRLQLLHVIERPKYAPIYPLDSISLANKESNLQGKLMTELATIAKNLEEPSIECDIFVVEGQASRDITKFAKEHGSDLIVISTQGLTGVEHFLMGSVAEKVVRRASCPVWTIKPTNNQ